MKTHLLIGLILVSLLFDTGRLSAQDAPSASDRFESAAAGVKDRFDKDAAEVKDRREKQATETRQANQAANVAKAKGNIERALAILVPGGIPEGSPRKQQFNTAIDAFTAGDAAKALETFKAMSAEDPSLPPAEFMLSGITFAVGNSSAGKALLESNAIKHPDYPGVYLSFAQLAINDKRATDAFLHANRAAQLIKSGNLSPASDKLFKKQYYEVVASIQMLRNQAEEAGDSLERLQAIEPDLPFYFLSKARLAVLADQNDQALNFLTQHAQATGDSKTMPELTLVEWLKTAGKRDQAEQLLLKTVEENADSAPAQIAVAELHLSKENFPEALSAIERFQQINGSETLKSIDIKGRVAFAGLSYNVAAEHFRRLAKLNPKNPSGAIVLALSLVESDQPEMRKEALAISQRVASHVSQSNLALASLGYILQKNGESEKANILMRRVVSAGAGSPEISWFVAYWLAESNQKADAIKVLQAVVDHQGLFLYRSAARKLLASLQQPEG